MSWAAAKRHCEENGKRLPSPDEVLKEWKSFDSSNYIWTSKEEDSASAYYVNLRLGEVKTDFKSNQFSTVCVCPASVCGPAALKRKEEPCEVCDGCRGIETERRTFCKNKILLHGSGRICSENF